MHPILARGSRLALYLGVWTLVGVLLAALLAGPGGLTAARSLSVSVPLALVYAFFCLSAWYVARSTPLGPTGGMRLVATALTASGISSAAWLIVARGWLELFAQGSRLAPPELFPAVRTLVFGFGLLLYLLSLTVSYLLDAFERSRDAERRGLEAQVLAREAELRSLRTQIDPALPLQHAAFHQRADDGGSPIGPEDVRAARRFPPGQPGAGSVGSDYH